MFEDSNVKWISLSDMINAFLHVLSSNESQHLHMDVDAVVYSAHNENAGGDQRPPASQETPCFSMLVIAFLFIHPSYTLLQLFGSDTIGRKL